MKIIAEYIWHDGCDQLRGKSRTVEVQKNYFNPKSYSEWSYDGSSTGEAKGEDSEILIRPVRVFKDPFRKGNNVLVLCDCYYPNGNPTKANHRALANKKFNQKLDEKPWFGIEQEFFLMHVNEFSPALTLNCPYKYNEYELEKIVQGQYYCSCGPSNAHGRNIVDEAYMKALEAGVKCSGMNAEVAPSQWEIQVGPCEGIEAGDHLFMLRYILNRVAETHYVRIDLEPKPFENLNGSGCHVNFSTEKMRLLGGDKHILNAIEKLSKKHKEHMEVYGEGNEKRMTGKHETADYNKFSYGVADRGSSIRIPRNVESDKCGYFEDRRPSSNMNPYLVTSKLFDTCCL